MGLGARLRELRRTRRPAISQAELAQRLGLARTHLSEYERDRIRSLPEPELLRAMARELGTSVLDLLSAAGYLEPLALAQEDELAYRNLLLRAALVEDVGLRGLIGAAVADLLGTRGAAITEG